MMMVSVLCGRCLSIVMSDDDLYLERVSLRLQLIIIFIHSHSVRVQETRHRTGY